RRPPRWGGGAARGRAGGGRGAGEGILLAPSPPPPPRGGGGGGGGGGETPPLTPYPSPQRGEGGKGGGSCDECIRCARRLCRAVSQSEVPQVHAGRGARPRQDRAVSIVQDADPRRRRPCRLFFKRRDGLGEDSPLACCGEGLVDSSGRS